MRRVIFFLLLISGLSLSFMTIQEYNYKNVLDTNSKLTQDSLGFNPDYQRICAKSKSIKSYIEL